MLQLAIKAKMPLVSATTSDLVNLRPVLERLLPGKSIEEDAGKGWKKDGVHYVVCGGTGFAGVEDTVNAYKALTKSEASCILVNPPEKSRSPLIFEAGEIPVPKSLIKDLMVKAHLKNADELLPALGSCTIKEAGEIIRLTMARDGYPISAAGIMATRRTIVRPSRGVSIVDTSDAAHYQPSSEFAAWVQQEKHFFLNEPDVRLRPRGLLADGPPGTGKSAGFKWLATQWGVPLYRIDVGTVQNKWVGDSEANFSRALSQLDAEEPCVALFDEIEKMFSGHGSDSTGIIGRMLGDLLWWLQEHRSRVFVGMTTNAIGNLPPELYRPGRIDAVFTFGGLMNNSSELKAFANHVASRFPGVLTPSEISVAASGFTSTDVAHAAVEAKIIAAIKQKKLKTK